MLAWCLHVSQERTAKCLPDLDHYSIGLSFTELKTPADSIERAVMSLLPVPLRDDDPIVSWTHREQLN
jgi:hypothetical protein